MTSSGWARYIRVPSKSTDLRFLSVLLSISLYTPLMSSLSRESLSSAEKWDFSLRASSMSLGFEKKPFSAKNLANILKSPSCLLQIKKGRKQLSYLQVLYLTHRVLVKACCFDERLNNPSLAGNLTYWNHISYITSIMSNIRNNNPEYKPIREYLSTLCVCY